MSKEISVGIIGFGRWGEIISHKFTALSGIKLSAVADTDQERLERANSLYSGIKTTTDYQVVLHNPAIDAVVIATTIPTHSQITKTCLEFGKHVLCEKPIAMTTLEAEELFELATTKNLILMTDLTYLYNPAINKIKIAVDRDELGLPYNLHITRYCPRRGLSGPKISVIWDLLPHDVSIMLHLMAELPIKTSVVTTAYTDFKIPDVVSAFFEFSKGRQAQLCASLLDPSDVKRLVLRGPKGTLLFDEKAEETKRLQYFQNLKDTVSIPYSGEPLIKVCEDFIDSIRNSHQPFAGRKISVATAKILEKLASTTSRQSDYSRSSILPNGHYSSSFSHHLDSIPVLKEVVIWPRNNLIIDGLKR